ncbi:ATP-dependent zinc metalloprotease FtsH [Anaerostipes sp.]|uniref:ATP-dependent zinc metalloprotease FtsH n=1 Tax=Anaerostipes sp. TaxID=1872530 RepID=UPI003FF06868
MNSRKSSNGFLIILILLVIGIYYAASNFHMGGNDYSYQKFLSDVKAEKVVSVTIEQNKEVPTGKLTAYYKDDSYKNCELTDVNQTIKDIKADSPKLANKVNIKGINRSGELISNLLGILLPLGVVVFFMIMMMRQNGGGGNGKMMDFGKSRAKLNNPNGKKVTFHDVAGLDEEKEELEEVVEFLKNPGKFMKIGARIPKGVLLVGPPGTGKTLLAKAVAGEANVPFFSISGSDFVEMFVGVGAARVRDLFAEAKRNAPCIIFIDEIDAVARRRGSGLGGGHDEREQTLNQMLVEMDGFGVNEGIIMIAATNRVDILDPAILRPGRFDRKVGVGRPDIKGREEILKVHCRQKPLGDDVDLHEIARTTAGFAGADLENLMNEAAIHAAKDNRAYITKEDIDKSFIKVGIGTEKKSRIVPETEKRITAYHESGHALLFHLLPDVGPVYTVSIIPTGTGAAGYTMPLPENDNVFMTKGKMIQTIMVSLGGRIAEELIFDDVTTGASQDIKQVTQYARAMVTQYGMSEKLGLINYDNGESDEVFLGKEIGQQRPYGEETQTIIDHEVKRIVNKCYQDAKAMIEEHIDVLHKCAGRLLEKERIDRSEFESLFE